MDSPGPFRASAVVRAGRGRSDVVRARGAGPLRLLTPRAAGRAAWLVTSSLGGGLVDGDEVALDVDIEADATSVITTQASTKAYRGRTGQELRVRVEAGAAAIVVPDPLVPFADARVRQVTQIEVAASGSLVLADTVTAGRVAHGEWWSCERIDTTLSLSRAGVSRLHDRVVLDRADGVIGDRMRRFAALSTLVVVGPAVAEHARALLADVARSALRTDAPLVAAASSLDDDGVLVRIAGSAIELVLAEVRTRLGPACAALGEDPWSRRWL
ncbi:MAG: urease accessory protein UreD [Polyangiaceae bacterium]